MSIKDIAEEANPVNGISEILDILHKEGPVSSEILEKIAYYKKFHGDEFQENEEKIITSLGLFYKLPEPSNLYSFLLSGIAVNLDSHYPKSSSKSGQPLPKEKFKHRFSLLGAVSDEAMAI